MGQGGPAAHCGASPLQHHHRLSGGGLTYSREEAATVLDALYVGADDPGLGVVGQVGQQLRFVDIAGVAIAHHLGEADAAAGCCLHQVGGMPAALRDEGDGPRLAGELGREGESRGRDVQAHAVGAEHADASLTGPGHHPAFQLGSLLFPRLAEASGEEVDGAYALGDAVLHQARHGMCGHAGYDVVHRPGYVADAGIAAAPQDLPVFGVDGVQFREAHLHQGGEKGEAHAGESPPLQPLGRRHAGDGNAARAKQEIESEGVAIGPPRLCPRCAGCHSVNRGCRPQRSGPHADSSMSFYRGATFTLTLPARARPSPGARVQALSGSHGATIK
ncbi:hypothetical protein HRbin24_01803 [bacterium HR24]|nr:hypothetical protein HRbin24_01803 [bacterium HR24]